MPVRTTVTIDDELYREVKVRAAQLGKSVGTVIEDAIRASLVPRHEPPGGVLRLPAWGRGGLMPGVDLVDNAATRELMDQGVPVDARR